ncbi:MAG: hypothetical protein OEZ43_01560 [Gammaproteobacteria bacterium]|nr:hypothetical protein [Gammaproteobacteria bacterium]
MQFSPTRLFIILFSFVTSPLLYAQEEEAPGSYALFIENGYGLQLKWAVTEHLMLIPGGGGGLTSDLKSSYGVMDLGVRYYFNTSPFRHFFQLGSSVVVSLETVNGRTRPTYDLGNYGGRYGVEYMLAESVSIEGAASIYIVKLDGGYAYRFPYWRFGMSYYW